MTAFQNNFYRYHERKENCQNIINQSKKDYVEKRDYLWNLPNKRPNKLKEKLKELEVKKVCFCWNNFKLKRYFSSRTTSTITKLFIANGLITVY